MEVRAQATVGEAAPRQAGIGCVKKQTTGQEGVFLCGLLEFLPASSCHGFL